MLLEQISMRQSSLLKCWSSPHILLERKPTMNVFISYSQNDSDQVHRFRDKLGTANGIKIWIDVDDIEGGGFELTRKIRAAIQNCHCFLPVFSENSMASSWFHSEIRHAFKHARNKTIPILLNNSVAIDEMPKWIADKLALPINDTAKILEAINVNSFPNLTSRAKNYFLEKQYQLAIESYQLALGISDRDKKHDAQLHLNISKAFEAKREFDAAISSATKSINLKESFEAYSQRANCARLDKDYLVAKEDYEKCIEMNPDHARSLYGLGFSIFRQSVQLGDRNVEAEAKVIDHFRRGISACEKEEGQCSAELRFALFKSLGFILERSVDDDLEQRQTRLIEIARCFKNAAKLSPENREIRFDWGYIEHQLGNFDVAIECYRQSLEDGHPRRHYCLGYALLESSDSVEDEANRRQLVNAMGIFRDGANQFVAMRQIDSQVGCMVGEMRCLLALDRAAESIQVGKNAVSMRPNDIRVHLRLAEAYKHLKDGQNAAIHAKNAADRNCVESLELLANLCGSETKIGKDYLKRAMELRGEKPSNIILRLLGIRQKLVAAGALEPAEIVNSDTATSICKKRGWKCDGCCL